MVLELLITPWKAERNPWELFFIGVVYSSMAIFLGSLIFGDNVGIVMVFLTTLATSYLGQKILKLEEETDEEENAQYLGEVSLLKHHAKALSAFMFLFIGFVVAFSFWYIVLPSETAHNIFEIQEKTISCVNSESIQGCVTGSAAFEKIFLNNVKVLAFTLLFAFFYGSGALFILAWNAAIVGTAVGILVRNSLGTVAGNLGLSTIASYLGVYSAGLLRYMTHGVFEILAYFMVALAGGLISIAITKHEFKTPQFRRVMLDALDITALALGVLLVAAAIEVFITPALF